MKNEFLIAITQLSAEKNLRKDVVLNVVEAALVSAFKKDSEIVGQDFYVKINPSTGDVRVFSKRNVVEKVDDPRAEISLEEAKRVNTKVQVGDSVDIETTPRNAGRIAAQTAKQVVMQRLREAEREVIFEEFSEKEGDIVSAVITRMEPRQIILDLGKAEALLPAPEQVKTEHYRVGQRLKVYVLEVYRSTKGPQVIVSRTHKNLLRRLFELEVPEIYNGTVELKAIAREPGYRSKVAVAARQEGVDPVGSCVGIRGIRIQNIINELNGEKIDVIQWASDVKSFVANALSPSQALTVDTKEDGKTATVVVPDRQLSLAIGKEGQNARLAAKLTGWRIDIRSASAAEAEAERIALAAQEEAAARAEEEAAAEAPAIEEPIAAEAVAQEEPVEAAATVEAVELEEAPAEMPAAASLEEPQPAKMDELEPVHEKEQEKALGFHQVEIPQEPAVPAAVVERPRVRFAEEIFAPAPVKATTKEKKGKGKRKGEEELITSKVVKAKKSSRRTIIDESELDEYDDV